MIPSAIGSLANRIQVDFGCSVGLCGEIEWLFHHKGAVPDAFFQETLDFAKVHDVPLESIGREETNQTDLQQYEFRFKASDALQAAQAVDWLNHQLEALSQKHGINAERSAFHEATGICSGLHWHLHLHDEAENYLFMKQEEQVSEALSCVLGGLLETMPALMDCFAPDESSYRRITSGADHVPTKCCWGGNNRTTALRMPESVIPLRHIEHRVCGADADPYASAWAILVGIHYGLKHEPDAGEQCFGDANRPESDFPLLPRSKSEALEAKQQAKWLRDYERD